MSVIGAFCSKVLGLFLVVFFVSPFWELVVSPSHLTDGHVGHMLFTDVVQSNKPQSSSEVSVITLFMNT